MSIAGFALFLAACSSGGGSGDKTPDGALEDGATLGRIDRLPGGTPVPTDVRTLLTIECQSEQLIVRTNLEQITAKMPCDRLLPGPIIERFLGQPVAITYDDSRLKIENPGAGSIELPAEDAIRTERDATP